MIKRNYFALEYACTQPLLHHGQDVAQGQFFKRSKAGVNSEFFFSETGCLTKAKGSNLPYYLPIAGGRNDGFIPFLMTSAWSETQTASSMIRTPVADFISYDDNHCTKYASKSNSSFNEFCFKFISNFHLWKVQFRNDFIVSVICLL